MPTSIFFNGRSISVPGSYSEVDASALEQIGLGASGIVAVIGQAEGGIPVSEIQGISDFIRLNKPQDARNIFRSGDLREVADMLFAPGKDPDILAGAQQVVAMKVNPATAAAATLTNGQGNALTLTSRDYGAYTSQINVSIAAGTTKGKLLTTTLETTIESQDDVGGDVMFSLQYTGGSYGYTTMVAGVQADGSIKATATKTAAGAAGSIGTQLAGNGTIEVVSASAGDTTQAVTVYGLNASGAAVKETLTLNGTTAVPGSQVFSAVYGVSINTAAAGNVIVRAAGAGATVWTLTAGQDGIAATRLDYGYVNNTTVSVVADAAATTKALVFGLNVNGAAAAEVVTLNGTTPVVTTGSFSSVTRIVTGNVATGRTLTLTAVAAQATPAVQKTLQKARDFFNAKSAVVAGPATRGFIFTLVTPKTTLALTNLDVSASDVSITSAVSFYADLYAVVNWFNSSSSLVQAEAASGAKGGAPSNTSAPVFLGGGTEGTASASDWQDALNWLKRIRVNSVVVLTADPAIAAALEAHCAYMCGVGRSERDGFVGLMDAGLEGLPTKTEAKNQVVALNSRHIRACAQTITRANTAGEITEFPSYFTAALAAGMQAGAQVGTSLTHKYANVMRVASDSSWNPVDDSEEMIQAGLLFLEYVDGVGYRWVRNVTTHLSSDNLAYSEGSVNAAVNFAAFNFRTALEFAVGRPGFAGTVNAVKSVAINTLGLLVDAGVVTSWRSLSVTLSGDVMEVSVELAPVTPVNFVKNTIHLVTNKLAA